MPHSLINLSFAALTISLANAAPAPQYTYNTQASQTISANASWTTSYVPSNTGTGTVYPNSTVTYSASSTTVDGSSPYSSSGSNISNCDFGIPPQVSVDPVAAAAKKTANALLAKQLQADVTQVDRFNTLLTVDGLGEELLPQDTIQDRVVFNFNTANQTGEGGRLLLANENNFPILVDLGISTAVGFLEPCGMNSPHTHPRATEFLTVVQGQLETGFMLENNFVKDASTGALTTQVSAELSAFEATVFPQGSIHFQFNPTCEPATFVASLTSSDPGTSQIAQNFFFLDDEIVDITLGSDAQTIDQYNIDQFRKLLPSNLVKAMDHCMLTCGMN